MRTTSGLSVVDQRERLGAVRGLADDLEIGIAGEHAAEAVADHRMVVDDHQPDRAHDVGADEPAAIAGTRADSAVPPPAPTRSRASPATRATRWRMPVRPKPDRLAGVGARDGEADAVIPDVERDDVADERQRQPARVAPACRATLASASWAMRSSATSISGWSAITSPVTVTSAGMPFSFDHRGRPRRARRAASPPPARPAWTPPRDGAPPPGCRARAARRWPGAGRDRPAGRGLVRRLELGDDPDQALGDRVVDLAGHPRPLVEDAGLARLGEQLGVQAGVLHQRGLELGERLATLLVLLADLLANDRAAPMTTVWIAMITT